MLVDIGPLLVPLLPSSCLPKVHYSICRILLQSTYPLLRTIGIRAFAAHPNGAAEVLDEDDHGHGHGDLRRGTKF